VFWVFAQQWGRQLINLVMLGILSRLVGAVEFGLIALVVALLEFSKPLLDQGFSAAIIQFKDLTKEHLDTAFWVNMTLATIATAISFFLAGPLAEFYDTPQLKPVMQVMSFEIISYGLVSTQAALLNREMRFEVLAYRSFITTTSSGIIGIVLAVRGFGVWSLVARSMFSAVLNVIVLWTAAKWRPGLSFSIQHLRELFSFGVKLLGAELIGKVRRYADNFLIGYFFDPVALGYYSIGFKLVDTIQQVILGVFKTVSLPVFSEVQSERERLAKGYFEATKITSLVFYSGFVMVILQAEPLINIVFGPDWDASVPIMQWLAVYGMASTLIVYNQSLLVSVGRAGWAFWLSFSGALLALIGIVVGARFSIVGVAAGKSLAGLLLLPVSIGLILRILDRKFSEYASMLRPILVGTGVMAVVVGSVIRLVVGSSDLVVLAAGSVAGGVTYLAVIYFWDREALLKTYQLVVLALPRRAFRRFFDE
jgi:PST family polysaccharide transporter